MTAVDPLEVAAWRMAVGRLPSEDLPGLATEALVRGLDSPALRVLAGQAPDAVRESADLFRVALGELGIELPDSEAAEWRLARWVAAEVVAGNLSPARGANDLWVAYEEVRDNGDLRIFVGLASMLDDHPEDIRMIEADIVDAAQELLARPEPRRWIKLMAVRGRSPLKATAGPADVEVDPGTLNLTDQLRSDLAGWDALFVSTVSDWPASGGFESEHDAEEFVATGQQLAARLQGELGAGWHVEYMPEPIRPPGVKLHAARR